MFKNTIKKIARAGLLASLGLSFCYSAYAQQEIKIGVIYPLSGAAASSGSEMKNALELHSELIGTRRRGKFHTDSDGFEMHANMTRWHK